jgi:hypothetical protein
MHLIQGFTSLDDALMNILVYVYLEILIIISSVEQRAMVSGL